MRKRQDEVKKDQGFRSIGTVLEEYIRKRGWDKPFQSIREEEQVFSFYREMKGDLYQKYSKPVRFKRGILYIASHSASALQEIVLKKGEILEFMNQGLAKKWIREIRFMADAFSEEELATQNLETQEKKPETRIL